MRVRETEAEALMNAQKEQYEARITALEKVNTELTSALAKIQPLAGFGKSSIVLTRDAADEEKRQIEQEAMKWRDKYEEARGQMKEKEQTEKELKYELELERKNGQALKVKQQSSAPRPRGGGGELLGSDHPPTLQTIRFYEDFTNLLIVRMKPQLSSFLDLQDWTMGCIFTYIPENDEEKRWSLNFNLTCSWEKRDPDDSAPVTSTSDLHEMMYYEPLELDKESPEIVARLGIISSGFSFTRDQVALFLRTLYNTFEEAVAGPGEEEKGEEGEEMSVSD
ncbi:hypothetical protein BDP27DRAFT_598048 [Rhodocollybia butyracea]|uniref:Uncharacterized protein n=1 Tax=Rhodocollybia butyracea TaxID=206335 RepID=A0A9P5Q7V3_9AGAR|nr:hypothetical protein BDP27DRAFT_598048 [Rhodocollybia butyracea]